MPTSRSRIDLSTLHSDEPKKITLLLTQSEFSLLEAACQITGHKPPELLVELFRTEIKPKLARTLSDLRKETEQQASSGQAIVEILTAPIPEPRRSAP